MLPSLRLLLLALLGATILASAALNPLMIYIAAAYIILLLIGVGVDVWLSPKPEDFEIERIHDSKLSMGADNLITILFANRSANSVDFQIRDEYPDQFIADQVVISDKVGPYGLSELRYHLKPLNRGDYQFGKLNLRYNTLLGLIVRQTSYAIDAHVKVYPNLLDLRKYDLLVRRGLLQEAGLRASRLRGGGTEFERLREYNSDDEFRRINWKATARRGKLITAEFEMERSQHIVCMIDTGRLMRTPIGELAKLDYVLNTALMLSYVALLRGDHVGLLSFADDVRTFISPKRGTVHFNKLLETLYNVQYEMVEADYSHAFAYLELKQKRRSLLVVFTDVVTVEAAKPLIAHLAHAAKRYLPLCVMISDPNVGDVIKQPLDSSGSLYQRAVAEMLVDERRLILETMHRSGVMTVDVPADQLTTSVINKYMELKDRGLL
jgi:uncharacterized protein (DUF58 family)